MCPLSEPPPQLPKPTIETFGELELTGMDERQADVLRMLSGIEPRPNGKRWTLQAVADEIDVTRERVRQLREDGLATIRADRERQRGLR